MALKLLMQFRYYNTYKYAEYFINKPCCLAKYSDNRARFYLRIGY